MPAYEYECPGCGCRFIKVHHSSLAGRVSYVCPNCKVEGVEVPLRRVYGVGGIIVKGGTRHG